MHMPHFSGGFLPPLSFWACSSSRRSFLPCRDRCLRGWGRPGLPEGPLQGTSAFWQALGLASPPQHAGEACVPPAWPGRGGGGVSGAQLCGAEPGTLGAGRTDIPRPWTSEDPAWAGLSVGAHGPAHARGPGPWLLPGFVWAWTAWPLLCGGGGRSRGGAPVQCLWHNSQRQGGSEAQRPCSGRKAPRHSCSPAPRAPLGNVSPEEGGWPLSPGSGDAGGEGGSCLCPGKGGGWVGCRPACGGGVWGHAHPTGRASRLAQGLGVAAGELASGSVTPWAG